MDIVKEWLIEGCLNCGSDNSKMEQEGCGLTCSVCKWHRCFAGCE